MRNMRIINYLYFLVHLLIIVGFILRKDYHPIFNPVITGLFYLGVLALERFTMVKFKNYIKFLLMFCLLGHTVIGKYYDAYFKLMYFDKLLHFEGSFAFAIFSYTLIKTFIKIEPSRPLLFTFIFLTLLGLSIGSTFEIIEFVLDRLFNEDNQQGLVDTDTDLFFDLIGGLVAGVYMTRFNPFSPGPFSR